MDYDDHAPKKKRQDVKNRFKPVPNLLTRRKGEKKTVKACDKPLS